MGTGEWEFVGKRKLGLQIISVRLNSINNSFCPKDDAFILDFQTPQSTIQSNDRKMNLSV